MNHWLKCDLVTQLNFPSKTFFLIIILNFQWQKLLRIQSFNSTYILALKISKWLHEIPLTESFPTIPRVHPNSPIIFTCNLNEYVTKIYSTFNNNFFTIGWKIMKPIQCTSLLIEGFPIGLRAHQEAHDLGDISVTNTTKETTFL